MPKKQSNNERHSLWVIMLIIFAATLVSGLCVYVVQEDTIHDLQDEVGDLRYDISKMQIEDSAKEDDSTDGDEDVNDDDGADEAETNETSAPEEVTSANLYLVNYGDNGQTGSLIGCGDSLVTKTIDLEPTTTPITDTLTALFAYEEEGEFGVEMNPLNDSEITIENVVIDGGAASVYLSGSFNSAGACEDPRIEQQLKQTVLQFDHVSSVQVYVNDEAIEDYLSGT